MREIIKAFFNWREDRSGGSKKIDIFFFFSAALLFIAIVIFLFGFFGLIVIGVLTVIAITTSIKIYKKYLLFEIPISHIGVTTLWGERRWRTGGKIKIAREGKQAFWPYWPFFYSFALIDYRKTKRVFEFNNIRCAIEQELSLSEETRAGGEVTVEINITAIPDYESEEGERLVLFIDSGGMDNVLEVLYGAMDEDIRQTGKQMSWESLTFAGNKLANGLIQKVTVEDESPQEELQKQKRMNEVGLIDNMNLGVRIMMLHVGKIKEEGELAEIASSQAREIQERRAEEFELETEIDLARKLKRSYEETGETKNLEECLLEIRRRKAMHAGHGASYDLRLIK